MRTILLRIAYDGTRFAGWQVQPNGLGVQQVVEDALVQILGAPVRLHSSGRTDAGVHARDMAAHFETSADLPLTAFREGVNRFLPEDVAIREVREMEQGFHARFSARGKWYRYTIQRGATRSPLAARFAWYLRGELDLEAMRAAAAQLVGTHDFAAFRTAGCAAQTTVRTLFSVDLAEEGDLLHIDVRGSGFLRNMVRLLVGTLVEIGRGRRPVTDVARLLSGDPEVTSGATAPPRGLCLQRVWYDFDAQVGGLDEVNASLSENQPEGTVSP